MARCSPRLPAMRNPRISASSWRPSSRKFPLRKTNNRLGTTKSLHLELGTDACTAYVCGFNPPYLRQKNLCSVASVFFEWLKPAFIAGSFSQSSLLFLRKLCKIRNFSQSPFGGFISEESDGNFPSGRNWSEPNQSVSSLIDTIILGEANLGSIFEAISDEHVGNRGQHC